MVDINFFATQSLSFNDLEENIVRKGENGGNNFLLLLAHLSTKCSEWAIVITHYPSSSVSSHFLVYTLASTNINQSAPNLVKMYMTIRSRMGLILGLIGPEQLGLSALELENAIFDYVYTSICKYWPISTKLGHNIYAHEGSDESDYGTNGQNVCDHKITDLFDYGSNRTRTVWVICPWIRKFDIFDFVYTLASAKIDQSVPNLATI